MRFSWILCKKNNFFPTSFFDHNELTQPKADRLEFFLAFFSPNTECILFFGFWTIGLFHAAIIYSISFDGDLSAVRIFMYIFSSLLLLVTCCCCWDRKKQHYSNNFLLIGVSCQYFSIETQDDGWCASAAAVATAAESRFYVMPYTLRHRCNSYTSVPYCCCHHYECRATKVIGITFRSVKMYWSSVHCMLRKQMVWRILHVSIQLICAHLHSAKHWWGEEKFVHFRRYLIYIECDIKLTKITYEWTVISF